MLAHQCNESSSSSKICFIHIRPRSGLIIVVFSWTELTHVCCKIEPPLSLLLNPSPIIVYPCHKLLLTWTIWLELKLPTPGQKEIVFCFSGCKFIESLFRCLSILCLCFLNCPFLFFWLALSWYLWQPCSFPIFFGRFCSFSYIFGRPIPFQIILAGLAIFDILGAGIILFWFPAGIVSS